MFGIVPRKYISKSAVISSATKIIPENSLAVITRVGIGKLAIMPFSYTTSQDFLSLGKLKTDVVFTAYLLYKKLQEELNFVQGTSIKGITKDELLAKIVVVPECKEQEAIGAYFSSLDNLITLHQRKPFSNYFGGNIMLNQMRKTDLFCEYYSQWITVYKEGAIRKVTMDKYLMTKV